jgi:GT2 family glycosyltransferase
MTSIPLSVVIPTYGRSKDLEGLLRSVRPNKKTHEVIVVDDCSENPNEFDSLKKRYPDVCFSHLKKNIGPGQARNEGAKIARGEIILYLDSDTELVADGINQLISFSQKRPDINMFSGWDSSIPLNSGFFPRFKALFMVVNAPEIDADVSSLAGRCFAIRRQVMLESGGFDVKYKGADVEDFELGYRLRLQYGKIKYISKLRVKHRYPSLWKQFKLYFKRIRMWMDLKKTGEGFDKSFGMRQKDAIIQILSALWPFVVSLSLSIGLPQLGLTFIAIAMWVNWKFLSLCIREEGVGFMILSVLCHSFLAIAVLSGALLEVIRKPEMILSMGWKTDNGR